MANSKIKRVKISATTYDVQDPTATANATASTDAYRDANGNLNAVAFNLCTVSTSTQKGAIQYNPNSGCVEIIC